MQIKEEYIKFQDTRLWTKRFVHEKNSEDSWLVFLHDALGSVEQWKDFPEKLAGESGFNVLLYDRLNHGKSDEHETVNDHQFFDHESLIILPALLKKLAISDPILYGHSDGGTIALIYASKFRTKALLLEAAHIMVEDITRKGVINTAKSRGVLLSKLRKYHGDKSEMLFDTWMNLWSGDSMKDWNIEYLLSSIKAPVLIMQGRDDNYGTLEQVKKISSGIDHECQELVLEDCGHHPHKELPEEIVDKVNKFLNAIQK